MKTSRALSSTTLQTQKESSPHATTVFCHPPHRDPPLRISRSHPMNSAKGESRGGTLSSGAPTTGTREGDTPQVAPNNLEDTTRDSDSLKQKRVAEEMEVSDAERPRKTRGICTDYRKLNNPYTHEYCHVSSRTGRSSRASHTDYHWDCLRPYLILPPRSMCCVRCRVMCRSCVVLRPSVMFHGVLILVSV
jgi:hypothetical protein